MPRRLRERFTYANVMSTLAVFLVLGTGTAYASHLLVRSSDVVDESLLSADLKNGSAVKGSDVVNDSLEGADIKEGTLGQVRTATTATVGGLGRSAASSGVCDPETGIVRCVQVQLDLQTPARVLLNARIAAFREPFENVTWHSSCRWGGVVESGFISQSHYPTEFLDNIPMVGLTNVIQPGQGYTFAVECQDVSGNRVAYNDAWITAVAISPS